LNTRRIILFAVAALLVFGIGNFAFNAIQTRSQLAQVAAKDPQTQQAGVERLMGRGVLFDALQGGAPPETRLNAINTLARMAEGGKNEAAFKELLQMLKDPDTESAEKKTHPVRDAAKDAVAKVGAGYPDTLLDAAKNPDNNIRDQSRNALKQIGAPLKEKIAERLSDSGLRAPMGDILSSIGPDTIPLIAPYLGQAELDKYKEKPDDLAKAKIELIEMLGKFKVPQAATPIIPFQNDENPNVRRAVITSLANIADPVGAPVLISALTNPETDASARAAAAGALGAIATPEANEAMRAALSDYDTSVAIQAAAGLRRASDKAIASVAQALSDPNPAVRARAAEAAGGMRTANLAVRALSDSDPQVRAVATASLGDVLYRANGIRTDIRALAQAVDVEASEKAYKSLQTKGAVLELFRPGANPADDSGPKARQNMISYLENKIKNESDEKKRKPFEDALAKYNDPALLAGESKAVPLADGTTPAALAPLFTALRDSEGIVGQNALEALGRIGEPAIPGLVALLGGSDETVAYRASQALARIQRPAVDSLLATAQSGQAGARWAAITLGEIGDNRAVPALETLSKSSDPDTAYAAGAALAKVKTI
jgi:HEAT repeat protein